MIGAEQRLTSELAHELRTPLTAINGAADLLTMRSDLDDEARQDVAFIKNACTTMSNTITVLLNVARRQGEPLRTERTLLGDLGRALAELPRPAGVLHVDPQPGLAIDIPEALAIRSLAPVVTNALQVADTVWVSARLKGRMVSILTADDGPGIPADWAQTLFEPGRSGHGGSGLGLALAQRVARSGGGGGGGGGEVTLHEHRNADGGATFAVTFPGSKS